MLPDRFDGPTQHERREEFPVLPGERMAANADLFLNDLSRHFRYEGETQPPRFRLSGVFAAPGRVDDRNAGKVVRRKNATWPEFPSLPTLKQWASWTTQRADGCKAGLRNECGPGTDG